MKNHKINIDTQYDGKILNRYVIDESGKIDVIGKAFNIGKVFYLYHKKYFFWFRFFNGYGVWGRSQKAKAFEFYSERYSHAKYIKIFGWKFKLLKP